MFSGKGPVRGVLILTYSNCREMVAEKIITNAIYGFLDVHKYDHLKLKAVLFDMDGVLFDSMKNHTLAWYKAISGLGIPCEQEEFYQYEGATGKWTINHIFRRVYGREATEEEIEDIYEEKSRFFNAMASPGPMPGAWELLDDIRQRGITPVLVTGSGQRSLLAMLNQVYPDIFAGGNMVTAFDVRHGKPDAEPYIKGLEKAGVRPWEAIVVENAPLGVKAGVAAGIFTVALNTGPIPDKQLEAAGANLIYPDMRSFGAAFDSLARHFVVNPK